MNKHILKPILWLAPAAAALATAAYVVSAPPRAQAKAEAKAAPKSIAWEPSFEAAQEKAQAQGKLVMVVFHARWCGACRSMDKKTFTDARVAEASRRFVCVKVDVDKQPAVAARYGVRSLPTVGWLRGDGSPIGGVTGAYPPKYFLLAMDAAQKRADGRVAKDKS